jgi:hypothetical protein
MVTHSILFCINASYGAWKRKYDFKNLHFKTLLPSNRKKSVNQPYYLIVHRFNLSEYFLDLRKSIR